MKFFSAVCSSLRYLNTSAFRGTITKSGMRPVAGYIGEYVPQFSKIPSNILFAIQLHARKEIDVNLLETAIIKYIKTQPNFNAGVKIVDDKPFFVPLDSIKDIIEILPPNNNVTQICLKYCNNHFREDFENFPGIKIFYIPKSSTQISLVIAYAHHCGDGTNGMEIIHAILDTYSKLNRNLAINLKMHDPPPSIDELVSSGFGSTDPKNAKKIFIKSQLENLKKCNAVFPITENEKALESHFYYNSTSIDFQNFIKKCKEEKVTVGVALTTAMNYGFAGYLFNHYPSTTPDNISISYCLNTNLRGRTTNDISWDCVQHCSMQNLYNTTFKIETSFWDICRKTKKVTDTCINELKFCNFDFLALDEIANSDIAKTIRERPPGLLYSHEVTNMNRYPASIDYDDFSIESIHSVGGQFILGYSVFAFGICSTNKFHLSLIHRNGEENTKRAQQVWMYIKYIIENMKDLEKKFNLLEIMQKVSKNSDN